MDLGEWDVSYVHVADYGSRSSKGAIWTDSVGLIFASDSVERGEMLTYRPRRHVIITEKVVRLAVVSQKESASSTNFRLVLRIQQTDSCCFGCSAQTLTASNQRYDLSALFHDQRATDLLLIYRIERIQQVVQAHLAKSVLLQSSSRAALGVYGFLSCSHFATTSMGLTSKPEHPGLTSITRCALGRSGDWSADFWWMDRLTGEVGRAGGLGGGVPEDEEGGKSKRTFFFGRGSS